jgi:hypothetical protein
MPSESNHIDNFFRRKETAAPADKARMELHWRQMQELLNVQPSSKPAVIINYRTILKCAAIILLIASIIFLIGRNTKEINNIAIKPSVKTSGDQSAKTSIAANSDTIIRTPVNAVKNQDLVQQKSIPDKKPGETKDQQSKTVLHPAEFPEEKLSINNPSLPIEKEEEQAKNLIALNKFFGLLKKEPQNFNIHTSKDTTIVCDEGTSLVIPSGAFQTLSGQPIEGVVTISIKEFYSIADIISNNLTTTSDGKPLITGGMLNISAEYNKQKVQLRKGSSLDVKMPTRIFNPEMQLFTAKETNINQKDYISAANADRSVIANSGLNWLPAGQQQLFFNEKKRMITMLDLQDNHNLTLFRMNKRIVHYVIPYDCPLTTTQMKQELEKRYSNQYDVIRVRRAWKPLSKKRRGTTYSNWYDDYGSRTVQYVGDSVRMPLSVAMRRKLITREDSLRYEAQFLKEYEEALKKRQAYNEFILIKDAYSFTITELGWINCDRFFKYSPDRVSEFYVKTPPGFEESYFASMLIFENNNSALMGSWSRGQVNFSKLPIGNRVNVICLAAKEGKMYSTVQQYTIDRNPDLTLKLEEITPEQFKEKLGRFGNVQRAN